jgi:hypothetical protein
MKTLSAADLTRWTPIALDLDAATPSVDWADFGERRFSEPFFDQTVSAWAALDAPPVVRTGLEALVALDAAPSLDPAGLIFHLPRSGSTLLARLLRQIAGCVVLSEPAPVNSVLTADSLDDATRAQLLRLVIRALGRRRFDDERHLVVKLSSWNVRRLALFVRAFPETPAVWLQRDPAAALMSMLGRASDWFARADGIAAAGRLFDLAPEAVAGLDRAAFHAHALAQLLSAVDAAPSVATLDYTDLPEAAWSVVAPRFGLPVDGAEIARMQAEARYESKDAGRHPFAPRHAAVTEPVRQLAATHLDAPYARLRARRAAPPGLPPSGA